MNKLRIAVTVFVLFVMITTTPFHVLAIVFEDYDARTFDEFQPQVPHWQNGVPTYEEAHQLLDSLYETSGIAPQFASNSPTVNNSVDEYNPFESNPSDGVESVPPQRDPVEQTTPSSSTL